MYFFFCAQTLLLQKRKSPCTQYCMDIDVSFDLCGCFCCVKYAWISSFENLCRTIGVVKASFSWAFDFVYALFFFTMQKLECLLTTIALRPALQVLPLQEPKDLHQRHRHHQLDGPRYLIPNRLLGRLVEPPRLLGLALVRRALRRARRYLFHPRSPLEVRRSRVVPGRRYSVRGRVGVAERRASHLGLDQTPQKFRNPSAPLHRVLVHVGRRVELLRSLHLQLRVLLETRDLLHLHSARFPLLLTGSVVQRFALLDFWPLFQEIFLWHRGSRNPSS